MKVEFSNIIVESDPKEGVVRLGTQDDPQRLLIGRESLPALAKALEFTYDQMYEEE